ncbi:MAG TPA: hypothetical protein VL728_15355 [Cyclobacteriaceae bacterium]|nr:hypothetical protein [Cyclobacteriaceae bacterium]
MRYVLASLFTLSFLAGQAQQDIERYMRYNKGERWRRSGIGLTIGGGVLTVVGISLLSSATTTTNAYGQTQYAANDPNAQSGVLCLLGGMGMLGAGIPLWIVGSHKVKKYRPTGLSLNLNAAPQGRGLGLGLRF